MIYVSNSSVRQDSNIFEIRYILSVYVRMSFYSANDILIYF